MEVAMDTSVVSRPPMPMEPRNGGSDTDDSLAPGTPVWSRQHQAIEIKTDLDVITDDGRELVAYCFPACLSAERCGWFNPCRGPGRPCHRDS
jgi:hypothetical protein